MLASTSIIALSARSDDQVTAVDISAQERNFKSGSYSGDDIYDLAAPRGLDKSTLLTLATTVVMMTMILLQVGKCGTITANFDQIVLFIRRMVMNKLMSFGAIGIVVILLFACSSTTGTPINATATQIQPSATEKQATAAPTETLQSTTIVPQDTQEPTSTEDLSERQTDVPETGFDPENTIDDMVMVYVP